jgi:hypothetical protein
LGSCSYKPTETLKTEKLQVTTHIENKQGSYTHKPTKKNKNKKVATCIGKKQSPKLKCVTFERKKNPKLKTHQDE